MSDNLTGNQNDLLEIIYSKQRIFYINFIDTYHFIPKTVVGLSSDDNLFLIYLDDIELDVIEKHEFIKTVLIKEKSVAFVFGSLYVTEENNQVLSIIAANSSNYIYGSWDIIRNGDSGENIELTNYSKHTGDDPERHPGAWFLTESLRLIEEKISRYENIWEEMRQ